MKSEILIAQRALFSLALTCLLLAGVRQPANAQTQTITFASDQTWNVSRQNTNLGPAQRVCLNAASPANCPPGATLYGYDGTGWEVNLNNLSGAYWIWAPGITGDTSPAYPAEYIFSKNFILAGAPEAGSLSIAADDFAEVIVNGQSVGTVGSPTDETLAGPASATLTTFDLLPYLKLGPNVISIRAANGNFGCGGGTYSCNPAGVIFGGMLQARRGKPLQ